MTTYLAIAACIYLIVTATFFFGQDVPDQWKKGAIALVFAFGWPYFVAQLILELIRTPDDDSRA